MNSNAITLFHFKTPGSRTHDSSVEAQVDQSSHDVQLTKVYEKLDNFS